MAKRRSSPCWRGPGPRWRNWATEPPIEAFLDRIAALPPLGIYATLAALAALENIFPPVPADTAAALGGFLAARNAHLDVRIVYLVTVAGNVASAAAVYFLARRLGPALLNTRLGRRLLPERTVARVRDEFERHHVWGIFISRCLPVYRAVVPSLAGIMRIPPHRVLLAMAAASALFYGAVVWLAYRLGQNWAAVEGLMKRLGAGLGIAALLVTALLVYLAVRWRRRRDA